MGIKVSKARRQEDTWRETLGEIEIGRGKAYSRITKVKCLENWESMGKQNGKERRLGNP